MIVTAIRQLYAEGGEPGKGNPTGSRFGTCAAQSQLLRFPALSHPEVPAPRRRMNFEAGDRIEAWWGECIERAFPNRSGLSQEPFYFPVPLTSPAERDRLLVCIGYRYGAPGRIWGTVTPGFKPPTIEPIAAERVRLRLVPRTDCWACSKHGLQPTCRDCHGTGQMAAKWGFVLDPDANVVWAPTYVDRIINHPELGLRVLEKKSMSDWGFRRVLTGQLDYGYRCQLAGLATATGLDVVLLAYRKETAHLAELVYTRSVTGTRVDVTKLNGQVETFFARALDQMERACADCQGTGLVHQETCGATMGIAGSPSICTCQTLRCESCGATGRIPADLPGDTEWEVAQAWTPYDEQLIVEIQQRIRRVLLWEGDRATLHREAGPVFLCQKCGGAGKRTCPQCKGMGVTAKLKKPCGPCGGAMTVECETCQGAGMLTETDLSFPCSWCPVVHTCHVGRDGAPLYTLTVDAKPHYRVTRKDWDASGLTFARPEEGA